MFTVGVALGFAFGAFYGAITGNPKPENKIVGTFFGRLVASGLLGATLGTLWWLMYAASNKWWNDTVLLTFLQYPGVHLSFVWPAFFFAHNLGILPFNLGRQNHYYARNGEYGSFLKFLYYKTPAFYILVLSLADSLALTFIPPIVLLSLLGYVLYTVAYGFYAVAYNILANTVK